jgi:hypothetical protein
MKRNLKLRKFRRRLLGIAIYCSVVLAAFLADHIQVHPDVCLLLAGYLIFGSALAFVLTFFPLGDGCPPGAGMQ